MKEYMLLIQNTLDHKSEWSSDIHQQFLKSCETYIDRLKKNGKLISAQPLVREGVIISGKKDCWKEVPFNEKEEVQVGYYHIYATDLEEAIDIAKENPEFEYGSTARIEIRPIKTKETTTGFVYPKIQ